jgi:hypothetical protein
MAGQDLMRIFQGKINGMDHLKAAGGAAPSSGSGEDYFRASGVASDREV